MRIFMKFLKDALSDESSVFLNLIRLVACEMVFLGHFLTKYQPIQFDALFRFGRDFGWSEGLLIYGFFPSAIAKPCNTAKRKRQQNHINHNYKRKRQPQRRLQHHINRRECQEQEYAV
jgi:hypothetical protein